MDTQKYNQNYNLRNHLPHLQNCYVQPEHRKYLTLHPRLFYIPLPTRHDSHNYIHIQKYYHRLQYNIINKKLTILRLQSIQTKIHKKIKYLSIITENSYTSNLS